MSGLITPPTSISVDGGQHYDTGQLQFVAGVGLVNVRATPGGPVQFQQNTLRVDPPEVFSVFAPGLVTARNIGVWRNTRANQRALALVLEANIVTAPTAGDGSNYWALRAQDGVGNNMQLPISTNTITHYVNNQGNGVVIARPKFNGTSPSGSGTTLAQGFKFQPTQALVVTGLVATLAVSNFNDTSNFGTQTVRAALYDSAGNVITSSTAATTGPTVGDIFVSFPLAVNLANGGTYYAIFDMIDAYTAIAGTGGNCASGTDPGLAVETSWSTQSAPINMVGNGGCSLTDSGTATRASIAGYTITQAIQGTRPTGISWTENNTPLATLGLIGSGVAALLQGDVTLSFVSQGIPAAGAAGTDVNARVLLGVAA